MRPFTRIHGSSLVPVFVVPRGRRDETTHMPCGWGSLMKSPDEMTRKCVPLPQEPGYFQKLIMDVTAW